MNTRMLLLIGGVLLLFACAASAPEVRAAEQRCTDLGANCVCSEPLNTTNLPVVQTNWINPGDSTTKECTRVGSSVPGGAVESDNVSQIIARNDASMLAALPPGHQVQWAIGLVDNAIRIFFVGHKQGGIYIKRLAARFYIYHSPNFEFAGDHGGACQNSKLMQFTGPNSVLDKSFGTIHMYNFLASSGWSPGDDCCGSGPGPDQHVFNKLSWPGKWWRLEAIYVNRAGPNWQFKLYAKNITDGGPEYTVIDTTYPGTEFNSAASWTPPQRQDLMAVNNYRQGTCNGWLAISHYLMAGWDTDQNQRIGPAIEIEGSGGGSTPSGGATSPQVGFSP